jgi:hypothetical protein
MSTASYQNCIGIGAVTRKLFRSKSDRCFLHTHSNSGDFNVQCIKEFADCMRTGFPRFKGSFMKAEQGSYFDYQEKKFKYYENYRSFV